MSKRLLALMLVGVVSLAGLALAQDPPANDEPPVRLKKRKPRGDDKPRTEPDKPEEKKKEDKKDEKKDEQKAEPREADPVTPQEEEKEVLQRVVTNVHRVGERLAKNDLGEATQQTQRDILKDLESLIHRNENPPPQGGGQQDQNEGGGGGGDNQDNKNQQGGGQQNQKQQSGGQKSQGQSKGSQKSQAGGGSGTKSGTQQQRGGKAGENKRAGKDEKAGEKPGGRNGKNGNGGGGGDKDDRARNKNADLDKQGVWGHLPQTLRAQMDAYSNPQPFMPKYDDLIKRYYRTIAEQGRRKGE
jgi:hypothetical protein